MSIRVMISLILLMLVTTVAWAQASSEEQVERARKLVELQEAVTQAEQALKLLEAASPRDEAAIALAKDALAQRQAVLAAFLFDPTSREELQKLADSRFAGFGFGIAIGATIDTGGRDRIDEATVDAAGIVRVDRDSNTRANFMLESHYFFTPGYHKRQQTEDGKMIRDASTGNLVPLVNLRDTPARDFRCSDYWSCKCFGIMPGDWGWGPFVSIQPGSEDIIEAVGAGLMLGFKRAAILAPRLAPDLGDSFNIGAGVVLDPNAKVLGDGVNENQPLPAGETSVRLKETTQYGIVLLFSYSF